MLVFVHLVVVVVVSVIASAAPADASDTVVVPVLVLFRFLLLDIDKNYSVHCPWHLVGFVGSDFQRFFFCFYRSSNLPSGWERYFVAIVYRR